MESTTDNNNNTIGESQLRKVSKRQENKALNTDEEEVEVEDDILIYTAAEAGRR